MLWKNSTRNAEFLNKQENFTVRNERVQYTKNVIVIEEKIEKCILIVSKVNIRNTPHENPNVLF